MNLNEMIDVDLPSLQSIDFGKWVLNGRLNECCSLSMQSLNEMIRNN